jgi:hypothetical protein
MVKRRIFSAIAAVIALSAASLAAFALPASAAPASARPASIRPDRIRPDNVPATGTLYTIEDQSDDMWTWRVNTEGNLIDSADYSTLFYWTVNSQIRIRDTNTCIAYNAGLNIYDTTSCSNENGFDQWMFISGNEYTVMTTDAQYDQEEGTPSQCTFGPSSSGGEVTGRTCDASSGLDRWAFVPQ